MSLLHIILLLLQALRCSSSWNNNDNHTNAKAAAGDSLNIGIEGNFSCSELQRWSMMEKHYSNNKKDAIFALMNQNPSACRQRPVILLSNVQYHKGEVVKQNGDKCHRHFSDAVIFLSNFSINNNYSHFLHALLRLFCALLDARLIYYDAMKGDFIWTKAFALWFDENVSLTDSKLQWIRPLSNTTVHLKNSKQCFSADTLVYGSGCVGLLPPEKWFGYPGCRANAILPAFSLHYKKYFGTNQETTRVINGNSTLNILFGVRKVGELTGRRLIANIHQLQTVIKKTIRSDVRIQNISFEDLNAEQTVRQMSEAHVFISIHGAGLTNTFFMNPGSVVLEILPYPMCNCKSPDYFYGIGGYYHGSSISLNLRYFTHCVSVYNTIFSHKPKELNGNIKCNWRHLHAVDSVYIEESLFISQLRAIERELVAAGIIELHNPIINMNPHANG